AAEAEGEAGVEERRDLDVVGPQLVGDREVPLAADVRAEELLLEEAVLPLARVLPARLEDRLVGQDDERVARLLVERLERRVAAHVALLLREDVLEPRGQLVGRDARAAAHLAPEGREEEEEPA